MKRAQTRHTTPRATETRASATAARRAPAPRIAAEVSNGGLDFGRATRHLKRRDPRLAALIARVGRCRLGDRAGGDPFSALVRAILAQQLSGKAASTIHGRVIALVGGPDGMTPANFLALEEAMLRAAGVSRQKIGYLRDLAAHVADGRLDLHALDALTDDEIVAAITAVKGLGRWSAEMFLMFRLNRPDVFPVADLGIIKGVQKLLGMKRRPSPRTMLRVAEAWRPYRSVAAWYLWRIHE